MWSKGREGTTFAENSICIGCSIVLTAVCVCFQCYVTNHAMEIWTVMSESMNAFTQFHKEFQPHKPLHCTPTSPLHWLTHFPSQSPLQCVVISWETSSKTGSSSCMPRKRNTDSLVARCLNTSYTTTGLLHDRGEDATTAC